MLEEFRLKFEPDLASVALSATIVCPGFQQRIRREWMAHDKRYVAQKRQRRRRKAAKAKVKLYEQGKIPYGKLPALAKRFHARKMRALSKAQ
jgi:hypothetical protein